LSARPSTVIVMAVRLAAIGVMALVSGVLCTASPGKNAAEEVAYTGPSTLDESSVLRVTARGDERFAAVTYSFDGSPAATSASAPFSLRLSRGDVSHGWHLLTVQAVTTSGRRLRSPPVRVRMVQGRARVVSVSPKHGLRAALRALNRGHVTVLLKRGLYHLRDVRLGDDAQLVGEPGTVLRAPAGDYSSVLTVNGRDARIAHLTIDGGGEGPGNGEAIAVSETVRSLRASHLRIEHVRRTGFYAWGSFSNISLQDSTVLGDGTADAAVIAGLQDGGSNASIVRCRIRGFRRWGINFAQSAYGRLETGGGSLALDNVISNVDDPSRNDGTDEGGIWSGGPYAVIVGNHISRTTWDGIETVGSSERATIAYNTVDYSRTGIYIEHSTNHSTIASNVLRGVETGINVEWRYDNVGSADNSFYHNSIIDASRAGIFIDVGSDRNALSHNRIIGTRKAIVLQGASQNLVTRNIFCSRPRGRVVQALGLWDNGASAPATANRIHRNRAAATC
jgi:hypothetical protein